MSSNNINSGNKEKFGQINLGQLKAGIKKSDFKESDSNKAIFEKLDKDKNGILSQEEVDALQESLDEFADDRKITYHEGKLFAKNNKITNVNGKNVLEFLNELGTVTENILNTVSGNINNVETLNVIYKPNENGTLTECFALEYGNKLAQIIEKDGVKTTQYLDGENVTKEVINDGTVQTTITYDTEGNPLSKTRQKGVETEYLDSQDRVIKKETDKGSIGKEIIEYTYEDNNEPIQTKTTTPDGSYSIIDNKTGIQTDYDTLGNKIEPPMEQTPAEISAKSLTDALKNGSVDVTIDGKATGLTNAKTYAGKIKLAKGETLEDGTFPKALRMTLPAGYNGTMQLNLIDEENGVYETNAHDRRFQIIVDDEGNINVKSYDVEELRDKLEANQAEYRRIAEEQAQEVEEAEKPQEINHRNNHDEEEIAEIEKNNLNNQNAKLIAENLYKICKDNKRAINKEVFWNEFNKIKKENIIDVLNNYDIVIEESGHSSLINTICKETGASLSNRRKALNQLYRILEEKAKDSGVSEQNLSVARKAFESNLSKEFDSIGTINTKDMEKSIDFLRGAISGALLKDETNPISSEDAMDKFINGDNGLIKYDSDVQKLYTDARESEAWVAKTGDWICGLFGCTTIKEMNKTLGIHTQAAQKLAQAANDKDLVEFGKIYKETFGINFNPQIIQAREIAQENLNLAMSFNESYNIFAEIENKTQDTDYNSICELLKNNLGYDDDILDSIINSYAEHKGMRNSSEEDKKYILNNFITETKNNNFIEFQKLSKGKTLEQMQKELELLTKSAYGTNDIVKDVIQFNENMVMTDLITSSAFEIAGTVALQFVPGLGQMAAAKTAITLTKLASKGTKLTKITNQACKVAKSMYKINKNVSTIQKTSKVAMVTTQVLNTGIATSTVNLTNKKDVKTTLRKTLMNMSFAGIGAGSSILAPKLMSAFGITDKVLATELAEEIINCAGSYGVTKIAGDDYGTTDAFIDFITGLTISRLSHVNAKGLKPKDTHFKPNEPEKIIKPEPITPENPKHMVFDNKDFDVIEQIIKPDGQKVLKTTSGITITLDEFDRPVSFVNKKETIKYIYNSETSTNPSKIITYEKNLIITEKNILDKDSYYLLDYEHGKKYLIEGQNTTSEGYIKLTDYPTDAKIPEPDVFSKNLKEQIENCTSLKEIQDLMYDYNLYNTKYGQVDDLYTVLIDKEIELKGSSKIKPPHKPESSFITSSNLDNDFKNISFKSLGKKGIKLKYSHEDFIKDLKDYIDQLEPNSTVAKDLGIKFYEYAPGKYELVDIPNFDAKPISPKHKDVLDILNKYAKENEFDVTDAAIKDIEKFAKDVPEFMFIIGKRQHTAHAYSIDTHTLIAMQKALSYPEAANLTNEQKEILKMTILLHDIGKKGGMFVSGGTHSIDSKKYATKILERFNYTQTQKDKILNLIENHHWFRNYNKNLIDNNQVISMFGEDLPIAKIIAKADFESINDNFHLEHLEPGKKLNQSEYDNLINQKMNSIDNTPKINPNIPPKPEVPTGVLPKHEIFGLPLGTDTKLKLGSNVEISLDDPTLLKLCNELKEGEQFAIGCTNPKTIYDDVKIKIGKYEDNVSSHHLIIKKTNGQITVETHSTNPTVIIKNIPTPVNTNPAIAKQIEALKHKATSISTSTFIINGKQCDFEIFNGTQAGSNSGYYAVNKETGDLYYVKQNGAQGKAEVAAAKLYALAGVDVPEVEVFKDIQGNTGVISKYIPDLTPITSANALVNDGFGMDVLLANWDAVCSKNSLTTADGKKAVRIDCGGSFDYHAHQGGNKPFTSIPTELITLFTKNSEAAAIFGKMTRADLIASLSKATNLESSKIKNVLNSMNMPSYIDKVLGRQKFLKDFLAELKKTPQTGIDNITYIKKVMGQTLENSINQAKTIDDLVDIKQALQSIDDYKIKSKLQNQIAAKETQLNSIAPKITSLSEVQIENLLVKNGFNKNYNGSFVKVLDDTTKANLYQQYSSYSSQIISKIEQPLTAYDIKRIQTIMNAANGKYISIWQKDVNTLIHFYRNIQHTHIFQYLNEMGPGEWETLVNLAKYPPSVKVLESIHYYKGSGYHSINKALEAGPPYPSTMNQCIQEIQAYINTQVINSPIQIRRNEGYEVLHSVTIDGTTLDKAMQKALQHYKATGDKSQIELLRNKLKNGLFVAKQEHFMSASIAGPAPFESYPIHWTMDVKKGSKGVLLEGINIKAGLSSETEILLQKDSQIIITDLTYNDITNKWELKGSVSN